MAKKGRAQGGYRQSLAWHESSSSAAGVDRGNSSFLAQILVGEWCWGNLSAHKVQRIALAATKDGMENPPAVRLARLGSS
eukprot:2932530-Alexandrium_andersonii.AAC.1